MKINEKSSENHIKVHDDIYIDKRFQNISKMLPKSSPKPSKMVGVELGKSTSSLNKALRELPRRLLKWTWPQNSPKIFPEDLQNPFKMTSKRSSRCDHHDILIMISWWRHQEQCINWKTFITRTPDRFRRSEYTHFKGNFALRFSREARITQSDSSDESIANPHCSYYWIFEKHQIR